MASILTFFPNVPLFLEAPPGGVSLVLPGLLLDTPPTDVNILFDTCIIFPFTDGLLYRMLKGRKTCAFDVRATITVIGIRIRMNFFIAGFNLRIYS
jgi:hypothetical protein